MIHKDDRVQYWNTCVRAWPRLFGTLPFTFRTFTCHLTTWLTLLVPSLSLAQGGSNSSQSSVSILGNWPIRGMEILQLRQEMSLEWMKSSSSIKLIALRLWLLTSKALLSSHLWWYQWLWCYLFTLFLMNLSLTDFIQMYEISDNLFLTAGEPFLKHPINSFIH